MLLLGHYMYLTVPFFSVDFTYQLFFVCSNEVSLATFGGPEDCEEQSAEFCRTERTIKDTMSCRSSIKVAVFCGASVSASH